MVMQKRSLFSEHQSMSESIIAKVADYFNLDKSIMVSKNRFRQYAEARQIAQYIINLKMSKAYTYMDIGLFFNCDHSTVTHSIKNVSNKMDVYPAFKMQIDDIATKFRTLTVMDVPMYEPTSILDYTHDFENMKSVNDLTESEVIEVINYMKTKF
jgi:hypothetical protein